MARKKKTPEQDEQLAQPAAEQLEIESEPEAVIVRKWGRVTVERNREITICPGDVFRHHMAHLLWTEVRHMVDPWTPGEA